MSDYIEAANYMLLAAESNDSWMKDRALRRGADELTRLQSDVETLRWRCGELESRADNCEREARQWRQEARAQSSTVAEIYQELTGKTGEPGDWNGARPLVPAILRKQAEKLEEIARLVKEADEDCLATVASIYEGLVLTSSSLRQEADEAEKAGGE